MAFLQKTAFSVLMVCISFNVAASRVTEARVSGSVLEVIGDNLCHPSDGARVVVGNSRLNRPLSCQRRGRQDVLRFRNPDLASGSYRLIVELPCGKASKKKSSKSKKHSAKYCQLEAFELANTDITGLEARVRNNSAWINYGLRLIADNTASIVDNSTALHQEITDRTDADDQLDARISDESNARIAADGVLSDADDALQSSLDAEAAARISGDSNEATARENADSQLQTALATETTARVDAINTEAAARQSADDALQTSIDDEASTRADADAQLQAGVDTNAADISANTASITGLSSRVDTLEASLSALSSVVDQTLIDVADIDADLSLLADRADDVDTAIADIQTAIGVDGTIQTVQRTIRADLDGLTAILFQIGPLLDLILADVGNLQLQMFAASSDIATNTANIVANGGSIGTVAADLSDVSAKVGVNMTALMALEGRVDTLQSEVDAIT
jgi:hypothetical protein